MKLHALLLTLCLAASVAWAQQSSAPPTAAPQSAPPTGAAPHPSTSTVVEVAREGHHHLLLSNAYVRAYYVEVAPHQTTAMHHHGTDYVAVWLGHSVIDSIAPDGTVKRVVFEDGDVRYTPAGAVHAVTNQGDAPLRNWTVELLQNQGGPVCMNHCEDDPRAKDWPPPSYEEKIVGYGDSFRITQLTIKPKQTVSTAVPFPHVTIMLTDLHGHVGPANGSSDFTQKEGDILFHDPHGDAALTNVGEQYARTLRIEFKPVAGAQTPATKQ